LIQLTESTALLYFKNAGVDLFPCERLTTKTTSSIPVDRLKDAAYQALLGYISNISGQYVPHQTSVVPRMSLAIQLPELLAILREIICNAPCRDEKFQKSVVDNMELPGSVDFTKLHVNNRWLAEISLPGFYHVYSSWRLGFPNLDKAVPQIIQMTKSKAEQLVRTRALSYLVEDLM